MLGVLIGGFIAIIGVVSFVAVLALVRAFVLIKLWGWFMVPFMLQFMDKPPMLTYPIAIGLSIIVAMFNTVKSTDSTKSENAIAEGIGCLLSPFFILLMGWIVHLFM